jgi:hypothetical protein
MNTKSSAFAWFAWLAIVSLLAGCSPVAQAKGVSVWIDAPLDDLTLPNIQEIKISGHAAAPEGISRIEILINNVLTSTITSPDMEGGLANFHLIWEPPAPGQYIIQAIAYTGETGGSQPDSAVVTFGDGITSDVASGCPTPIGGGPTPFSCEPVTIGCPTPVGGGPTPFSCEPVTIGCPTPVGGGPTPITCVTPVQPLSALIQFWAEPSSLTAGACTTINWHVENASSVRFGGVNQPLDGSDSECLCISQTYMLSVTHLDGTEEQRELSVPVSGSCVTPPPPTDTTPPPAPVLVVPANGLLIACKANQTLAWQPVSDPSGIANYDLEVERHAGDNNWQLAPSGVKTVTNKTAEFPVECGWYYRWHVRARDGVGNLGSWSNWWMFTITLN